MLEHLERFGLEQKFATCNISELSGGQRARLVLAAAMWPKPHLLVLDEPTNYLDREALTALATALKAFRGAVVMVSHHMDYVAELCSEVWRVTDGKVVVEKREYDAKAAAYNAPSAGYF